MPKSPRNRPQKSSNLKPRPKTPGKPAKAKAPKLQGEAAKLANLAKAPSHHAKRKRAAQAKPAKPAPPPPAKPQPQLDHWAPIPLPNRARQERITHLDAWLQHIWHHDDGTMPLKNASHFAEELHIGVDAIYDD